MRRRGANPAEAGSHDTRSFSRGILLAWDASRVGSAFRRISRQIRLKPDPTYRGPGTSVTEEVLRDLAGEAGRGQRGDGQGQRDAVGGEGKTRSVGR
jgi:hypothetical protein